MRKIVFRVLAGLLSVGFLALILFGDTANMTPREKWGGIAIGVAFGLFALFGSEGLANRAIGVRDPEPGSKSASRTAKGREP